MNGWNEIIIDGIRIIDYISPMKADVVRDMNQDILLNKIAEDAKRILIERKLNLNDTTQS